LMAECVSNVNLDPAEQWDAEHEDLLARIGWNPPEVGMEDGNPNWWVWHATVTPPVEEVARMLLCTLRTVFGLRGRDCLTLKISRRRREVGHQRAPRQIDEIGHHCFGGLPDERLSQTLAMAAASREGASQWIRSFCGARRSGRYHMRGVVFQVG
jgi:hypothetical protein